MALLLEVPYNQLVTELLTVTARSSWLSGPANYLGRLHVDGTDGLANNHEDTIEGIAISNGRAFWESIWSVFPVMMAPATWKRSIFG